MVLLAVNSTLIAVAFPLQHRGWLSYVESLGCCLVLATEAALIRRWLSGQR